MWLSCDQIGCHATACIKVGCERCFIGINRYHYPFMLACTLENALTVCQKNGTEDIAAVVVPTEQVINSAPDDETLEKQVRAEVKNLSQRLSIFKRPTYTYVFKEPLERTATSKIKRKVLAEKIAQMKSAK